MRLSRQAVLSGIFSVAPQMGPQLTEGRLISRGNQRAKPLMIFAHLGHEFHIQSLR